MYKLRTVLSILVGAFLLSSMALASDESLSKLFNEMSSQRKGPFGLNMLQSSTQRVAVRNGGTSGALFQAAYRVGAARELEDQEQFYVGNLFTTNYYELMGEYVFTGRDSNHPLNHSGLVQQAPQAMPKTYQIVRHWILEKHYTEAYPETKLAKSFAVRGISGSEFEAQFATYFFNYYFTALQDEEQYLPGFLLLQKAPLQDTAQLQQARDLISRTYDYFKGIQGARAAMVQRLWALRNSIHNQLHPGIIDDIDQFYKDFPSYLRDGNTYLPNIQKILRRYYEVSADSLVASARSLRFNDIVEIASEIGKQKPTPAQVVKLARAAAQKRAHLSSMSWEHTASTVLLLSQTSQYLNSRISAFISSTKSGIDAQSFRWLVEACVHLAYIEGYLTTDHWRYYVEESQSTQDLKGLLAEVVSLAHDNLSQIMAQPLAQWVVIETNMSYFVDSTLKSSTLSSSNLLANATVL